MVDQLNRAVRYYAEWLCVSPTVLTEPGVHLVLCSRRDEPVAGYPSAIPFYAMVRDRQAIVAMGSSFATADPVLSDSLRTRLESLSPTEVSTDQLDGLLRDVGVRGIDWSMKYCLTHPVVLDAESEAFPLQSSDFERFRAFFRDVHPGDRTLDWLRPYFDSITRQRLCWAVAVGDELVAVTDAPSVPYMEDSVVEVGINTHPSHRRRGYGRLACQGMVGEILSRQKAAVWSCRLDNTASRALAISLGFKEFGAAAMVRAGEMEDHRSRLASAPNQRPGSGTPRISS